MSSHNSTESGGTSDRHPEYYEYVEDWRACRVANKGERSVKAEGTKYLKPTASMWADGYGKHPDSKGSRAYEAYKDRAVFPAHFQEAVIKNLGLLWYKQPTFELTPKLEAIRDSITRSGESVEQLLMSIHEEVLKVGRTGLHVDLPEEIGPDGMPYIVMYEAETIVNWDEGERWQVDRESLNLVVLNESGAVRNGPFSWDYEESYRVLVLGETEPNEQEGGIGKPGNYLYGQAVVESTEDTFDESELTTPDYRGNVLSYIPFTFINSKDNEPSPMVPPMLRLCDTDMAIYRGEADYRQALYMQGQDTLVLLGNGNSGQKGKEVRTGAGAIIELPNPGADAKYIGTESAGIPEQRAALENLERRAQVMAGAMTDTRSNQAESGETLKTRQAGQAVNLVTIAKATALGLQTALRQMAEWIGEDPEGVIVTPNLEFGTKKLTPDELLKLQAFKAAGGPISSESIHGNVADSAYTKKDYETEAADIESEEPLINEGDGNGGIEDAEENTDDEDSE